MDDLVHHWHENGLTITFTWLGSEKIVPSRVYAFAYSPDGRLLLVGGGPRDPRYWLPGGGIEDGETPEEALARELFQEAAATIHKMKRLGGQRSEDSKGACDYQEFYCCQITMAETFVPKHEVVERKLVDPADFLDTLFWGRADPKAAMLLESSQDLERIHRHQPET